MADFDIDQNIGNDLDSNFGEQQESTNYMEKIKPYIGPALKVLILILILFAAYYFFFIRYTHVTFEVINLDKGKTYTESTTISLELDGKTNDYDTDKEIKLLPGDYIVSINDPNLNNLYLKDDQLSITKDDDGQVLTIYLYPEWSKDLSDFKLVKTIETVYEKQNVNFQISIKNSGKPQRVTFIGTGDLNNLLLSNELKTGENIIDLQFENKKKNKEKVSGSILIDKADFLSLAFNSITKTSPTINIRGNSNYTGYSGEDLKMTLELDNTQNIDSISNLDINIDNASKDSDTIKSWIKNLPSDINIQAKSKTSVDIIFSLPLLKEKEDVSFTIYFKNDYINASKQITLNIKEPELILPQKIEFGLTTAGTTTNKTITIENKTNYPINLGDISYDISVLSNNNTLDQIYSTILINKPEKLETGKTDIPFSIILPPTFANDKIEGVIKIKSDIYDLDIPFSITIQGINIAFTTNLASQYSITNFDPISNYSNESQEAIKINNTGNIDVNLSNITISGDTDCTKYLKINNTMPIGYTLTKTDPLGITLVLQKSQKPTIAIDKICSLDIIYLDPRINTIATKSNQFKLIVSN